MVRPAHPARTAPTATDGADGAPGPTGETGPAGPTGPQGIARVNTWGGQIQSSVPVTNGVPVFVGPTTSVTVTSPDQLLVGSAMVPVAANAPGQVALDLCRQTNGSGFLTNFSFSNFSLTEVDTTRTAQAVSATNRPGPGTYTVGVCAFTNTTAVTLNDNDFVNGWVMAVNAPVSGGSSVGRPGPGRR